MKNAHSWRIMIVTSACIQFRDLWAKLHRSAVADLSASKPGWSRQAVSTAKTRAWPQTCPPKSRQLNHQPTSSSNLKWALKKSQMNNRRIWCKKNLRLHLWPRIKNRMLNPLSKIKNSSLKPLNSNINPYWFKDSHRLLFSSLLTKWLMKRPTTSPRKVQETFLLMLI